MSFTNRLKIYDILGFIGDWFCFVTLLNVANNVYRIIFVAIYKLQCADNFWIKLCPSKFSCFHQSRYMACSSQDPFIWVGMKKNKKTWLRRAAPRNQFWDIYRSFTFIRDPNRVSYLADLTDFSRCSSDNFRPHRYRNPLFHYSSWLTLDNDPKTRFGVPI